MKEMKENTISTSLFLSIKLGNPKYKCGQYGICEINPDDDGSFYFYHTQLMEKRAKATVFTTHQQQLVFLFDRHSLTVQTDKEHFSTGFFIVEVPKELPISVSNRLGIKPCQIEAGIYPIVGNNGFYKIIMNIKGISEFKQLNCNCTKKQSFLTQNTKIF